MKIQISFDAMIELRKAIENDDLDKVKELIQSGKAKITNVECMDAVAANRMDILKYILEIVDSVPYVLWYGLYIAITHGNMEALILMLNYIRDHKIRYANCDLDSYICSAINEVYQMYSRREFDSSTSLKLIKCIIDNFYTD